MRKYSEHSDIYTDPETGVLKNKLELTTEESLQRAETDAAVRRAHELIKKPVRGKFDLAHLCAIHQKLFGDVYEWAGKIREVDISKGDTRFAHHGYIESEAKKLTDRLKRENNLVGLYPKEFSERVAHYMGEMNVIHPFREGNGRTLRECMGQLAKQAGYEISWNGISRDDMIKASVHAFHGSTELLTKIIRSNLIDLDREHALARVIEITGKSLSAIDVEFGRSYEGKILAITDRYVAQIQNDSDKIVLHEKHSLVGDVSDFENKITEISYPVGRAGIIREPELKQEYQHQNKELER